jgi:hypothetical protein
MQHLSKDHGIREPLVNHVTDEGIGPPKTIEEFYQFPEPKGWCIDHKDYRLRVLPVIPQAYQDGTAEKEFEPKLRRFLQAWLFFGLIFTVVQKDNRPLMKYDNLVRVEPVAIARLGPARQATAAAPVSGVPGWLPLGFRAGF